MKKNIALVAGGYTKEDVISINSAKVVEKHIDATKYKVFKIIITRQEWYYEEGPNTKITVDKNDFSIILNNEKICFDLAFIIVHGVPGENGMMQAYFDMINIPYTTCDATVSAITMNKAFCNAILSQYDVRVAKSIHLIKNQTFSIDAIATELGFPCFVKPNGGGSSIGMTKVKAKEDLPLAIATAFSEDTQVLIEQFVKGRELSCGLMQVKGKIIVFPITEIISKTDFFDYEAKYKGLSDEVTPAQISPEIQAQIQQKSSYIYEKLNCFGIVRCDFILEEKTGNLYFLEVNTVPGQSEQSIVPQQVRCMGWTIDTLYSYLIEESFRK
ncbi:MAG: D-alanine--D-alanine ligase [Bacteroidales bacterium]